MIRNKYDEELVHYCKQCLSLAIKVGEEGVSYCDLCGCSSTGRVLIDEHSDLWADRYGYDFLTGRPIEDEKCKHCEYRNKCK